MVLAQRLLGGDGLPAVLNVPAPVGLEVFVVGCRLDDVLADIGVHARLEGE